MFSLSPQTTSTNSTNEISFTFGVDIELKQEKLYSLDPEEAFRRQVGQSLTLINFSYEGDQKIKLINCEYRMSGVMKAIHSAYMNHYNLKLSVSDFILMIGQGLAHHMEIYAKKLRFFLCPRGNFNPFF